MKNQFINNVNPVLILILFILLFTNCRKREESARDTPLQESGYFLLDEYFDKHPQQQRSHDSFRSIVQNMAVPLSSDIQDEPVTIAMIYPGTEKSDYWRRSVASFSARMDELAIQYKIDEFFSRPGVIDREIQEEQINEALKGDPDYLVFTLDVARHKEIIERIMTIGRPKLILQNITTPLKEWEGNQPFLYVGFSHKQGTESILIPEFIKRTGGSGSYAMLYFAKGFVSEQRGDTFISYMNENTDLELKTAYYTDGQFEKARAATEELLNDFPDIDFIYACSTSVALAAVEVLEAKGLKDNIMVNGWGGGSAELESIMDGKLDFTIMRINDDNGIAMAEAIKLDIMEEKHKVPTVFSGDFVLVKQGLTPEELNSLKNRAFRYSEFYE